MVFNPDFHGFDPWRWQFSALEFWSNPAHWPPDAEEQVFLARAVNILGTAIKPNEWDDRDAILQFAPLFVEGRSVDLHGPEQGYALRLLQEFRPDLGIKDDRVDRLHDEPLSLAEWTDAFAAFDKHQRGPRLLAMNRTNGVVRAMIHLLAAGDLMASTREMIGDGKFRPVASADWNRDGVESRFAFCLMSRTEPPDDTDSLAPPSFWKAAPRDEIAPASWPHYLFISRASLASAARSLTQEPSSQADLPVEVGNVVDSQVVSNRAKKTNRKFDWPSFHREVCRILAEEGDIDPASDALWTKAALTRLMADWCSSTWGSDHIPEDSHLRKEIDKARDQWINAQ